jgi:hypothetical protein
MEIQLTLNGRSRKDAARCVGEVLGLTPVYQRAPTYAYAVGDAEINRYGVLVVPDDCEKLPQILAVLQVAEFYTPEVTEEAEPSGQATEPLEKPVKSEPPDHLVIQMPLDGFDSRTLENLRLLLASKATLIKKALGVCDLTIRKADGIIDFPWFDGVPSAGEAAAYTQFITALCDMAKKQVRVLATEKPVENEKYAFRCFLLRLGFIGEEYAEARRVLLRNLSGNGSNKSGEGRRPQSAAEVMAVPTAEQNVPVVETNRKPPKPRFSFKKLFGGLKALALD